MATQTEDVVRTRDWERLSIRGLLYVLLGISALVFLGIWLSMPPESDRSLLIFTGDKIVAAILMVGCLIGIAASLRRD